MNIIKSFKKQMQNSQLLIRIMSLCKRHRMSAMRCSGLCWWWTEDTLMEEFGISSRWLMRHSQVGQSTATLAVTGEKNEKRMKGGMEGEELNRINPKR